MSQGLNSLYPNFGNPYNGYINPYYWVDDHPLLYGNNGSLDPSTRGCPAGFVLVTSCCCKLAYGFSPFYGRDSHKLLVKG